MTYGEGHQAKIAIFLFFIVIGYFLLALKFIQNKNLILSFSVFVAGICSNSIDRLLYHGMVSDPILITRGLAANFADFAQWGGILSVAIFLIHDSYWLKSADQRQKIFIGGKQQRKVFLFESLKFSFFLAMLYALLSPSYDGESMKLWLTVGILTVPLLSLFGVLLSNSYFGGLKGLNRYLDSLAENRAADFRFRHSDESEAMQPLIAKINRLIQK